MFFRISRGWLRPLAAAGILVALSAGAFSQETAPGGVKHTPKPPAAGEADILKALEQRTTFQFKETPLQDLLDDVGKRHRLQFVTDRRAFDDAGISLESPVTIEHKSVKLVDGLNAVLEPLELAWIIRDEVLLITTKEVAEETGLFTRAYRVKDLVVYPDPAGLAAEPEVDADTLIGVITAAIEPESWSDTGGYGALASVRETLLVRQTRMVHGRINHLLAALRGSRRQQDQGGKAATTFVAAYDASEEGPLRRALAKKCQMKLVEQELQVLAAQLSKRYGIRVQLDNAALDDAGIGVDTPVTLHVSNITLAAALKLLVEPLELTWVMENGELLLTTRDTADAKLLTRVYPVRDLVTAAGIDFDDLVDAITGTAAPDSWEDNGGPGLMQPFDGSGCDCLVITQTAASHAAIEEALSKLRAALPPAKKKPAAADDPDTRISQRVYLISESWSVVPFGNPSKPNDSRLAPDLAQVIQKIIEPHSWQPKDNSVFIHAVPGRLIVRHQRKVHRAVGKLLQELDVWPGHSPQRLLDRDLKGGFP